MLCPDQNYEKSKIVDEWLWRSTKGDHALEVFLAEYYLEDGDLYSMDNFAPTATGSTWNYSNIATSLAAYLVEAATGTPFKEYVTTNILQPLGMTKTAYDLAEKVHDTIVEFIQNN